MIVKPREGLKIRDHVRKDLIPETGREVPDNDLYWVRLLNDGDVVRISPDENPPVLKSRLKS